jgi:hypothetical protein
MGMKGGNVPQEKAYVKIDREIVVYGNHEKERRLHP